MAPTAHEMHPEQFSAIEGFDCEDQVEKLIQIVTLYSNYMRDCRVAREILSQSIGKVIAGTFS